MTGKIHQDFPSLPSPGLMEMLRHLLSVGRGAILMRAYHANDRESNAEVVHMKK